jgi:RNA polymerase sigma factor (sigma-70 family)
VVVPSVAASGGHQSDFPTGVDILYENMTGDLQLLREYSGEKSERAFAELTRRYLDIVYSAALRQVRSPELAQEVSQSVFMDLARQAGRLRPDTNLAAWLYAVTRRTAIDALRSESRRIHRERLAGEITDVNTNPSEWGQIEPMLDEAMEALEEKDRAAILMRFFQSKSLKEVGQLLGTSEDAAQKRVSRALDRLRAHFAQRGVAVGAGGLAVVLSANAVQAAPVGLSAAISTGAAVAVTAMQQAGITGLTKGMIMTTIQKAIYATALAAAVGAGIYEARRAAVLQAGTESLRQRQGQLNYQIDDLAKQLAAATNQPRVAPEETRLRAATAELLKLRGEVARLRSATQELAGLKSAAVAKPGENEVKSWLEQVNALKRFLKAAPDKGIPELQFLSDQDWFNAVGKDNLLQSDDDYREALQRLRRSAKNQFAPMMQHALQAFTQANDGQLPGDVAQLKPFFDPPVDDAILQRYQMVQNGKVSDVPPNQPLVAEKAPVDGEHDTIYMMMLNGTAVADGKGWNLARSPGGAGQGTTSP